MRFYCCTFLQSVKIENLHLVGRINFSFLFTLVKQIGCYGDTWNRALPDRKNLAWPRDKMARLKNVQDCRDHVLGLGGLTAGYKVS